MQVIAADESPGAPRGWSFREPEPGHSWMGEKVNKKMKILVSGHLPVPEGLLSSPGSGEMGGTGNEQCEQNWKSVKASGRF